VKVERTQADDQSPHASGGRRLPWLMAAVHIGILWGLSMTAAADDLACPGSFLNSAQPEQAGQKWLGGQFVYAFGPEVSIDPARIDVFESACRALLDTTALRCAPRELAPDAPDYVYVVAGGHDFSYVGRQGGCQLLSILSWNNPIVVAHEIKHALGWAHEQQHPDRERFIEVDFDAVPQRHQAEFRVRDLGNEGPYDFDSIMHFRPSDFARPGAVAFRPREGEVTRASVAGQRDHLSATDLKEIRAVYGAAGENRGEWTRQPALTANTTWTEEF